MTLSDDDARCQDNACPDRVICARWLQNRTGRVHQASFRKGQEHCSGLILCEIEYSRVPSLMEQAQEEGMDQCF